MTDQEIISSLKSNRPQLGLKELYKQYTPVKKFIINNGGSADDAYDIFQEAILVFYDKVLHTEFELSSTIGTYLFSISKYKWKQVLIAKNRLNEYVGLFSEGAFIVEENESYFQIAENALAQIGEKCKAILVSFYHYKLSMTKIAETYGFTSENVAKNQKYKCLEKARNAFKSLLVQANV